LVKNSKYNNGPHLKKRLFAAGLLKDECYECGQLPVWNNKPLILQLEHINGDHYDNRIENLQIICHSVIRRRKPLAVKIKSDPGEN
jgi:hypothetical protein